ncbi:MAG TPA: MBL fold metallo-hydrolase [Lentimicrobium sp.]|jgi:glyoxylase-like metal-dependent hydrolase (beta-lactamase superfamily II)|nr:MBL fold metallo-hydrolase [Lentimicrobium sp.]
MITVKTLVFNSFSVNTYIISDETGDCIIIDPGCESPAEQQKLAGYIASAGLTPRALVNTHFHVDHILGNRFVADLYKLAPTAHPEGELLRSTAREFGSIFGLNLTDVAIPEHFVNDGDTIKFGNSELEVLYTPGHADGSICLVSHPERFVISGDVLFYGSIGRTDLPTGDFDVLMNSIETKLFVLDNDYTVYPGHGPKTLIGYEKMNNPFIR